MRRCTVLQGVLVLLLGCVGNPVTPEQRRLAEERLLSPFKQNVEVGCGELLIEMTGNFYKHVARPAVDKEWHRQTVVEGDGFVETTWTNLTGQPTAPFIVTVGEPAEITESGLSTPPRMKFTVVNELKIRVHSARHELALNATASGPFVVVQEAGGAPRDVRELRVADGVLRTP